MSRRDVIVDDRSWLMRNRYLLARRMTQFGVLGLFLLGPLFGLWIIKGNLNSSLTLGVLPMTDPFVWLQALLAGQTFKLQAFLGALIIVVFYFFLGGRVYCAWVCPVNMLTDLAHWLRTRLGLKGNTRIHRNTRYWLLAMVLLISGLTGMVIWELVNPVSILHRGILFGMGAGWLVILAIFLFDLAVSRRGWCGHLCPMGAFYSLLGTHAPLRIRADNREACNQCMDCFDVCPEPQVIKPALFGKNKGIGPLIDEPNCTNCGRCIDVCSKDVFAFGARFGHRNSAAQVQRLFNETIPYKPEKFEHEEART